MAAQWNRVHLMEIEFASSGLRKICEETRIMNRKRGLFARDFLIPPEQSERLATLEYTNAAITHFAKELGIAPGIIVDRMQNEKNLRWDTKLNALKVTYKWNHA